MSSLKEFEGIKPESTAVYGKDGLAQVTTRESAVKEGDLSPVVQMPGLQRRLQNRQIQLIAIGGSIGTALFIAIGGALFKGGPGSLLLAYTIHTIMLGLVNNCMAEMTTYMPVTGGFIRLAGKWVDDAFGFMAGWNFFIYEALTVPFEIAALNILLGFWRDDIPPLAVCLTAIALYVIINVCAVEVYGEAEFWLSGGKVVLIFILFGFTFITMVGGNPEHDAYGFRYWDNPGAFASYLSTGSLGQFQGFLACLWTAIFTIVGPEYISMAAAEARHPRVYIKSAFKMVYGRFALFFVGGALCVGIILAYNDPLLVAAETSGDSSAGGSPYVIAMRNLGVHGLPNLASALMLTSVFSAGNTYFYAASRALHGLAIAGRAPEILRRTTKKGVPVLCLVVTAAFACLSLLSVTAGAFKVLDWLIDLTTANILINYIIMMFTYVRWYHACKAQNLDRRSLPYFAWFQPYCGYIALVWMTILVFCYGYTSFKPWSTEDFFLNYIMLIFMPFLYIGWKLVKKTRFLRTHEVDLVWEAPLVAAYEAAEMDPPTTFWREMLNLFTFSKLRHRKEEHV